MISDVERIRANVSAVRERIAEAARRSGRAADGVTLVAVTKYVDLEWTRAVVAAGCHDLGESRPQQLWSKAESLVDPELQWHLIGSLQRNKVRRTVRIAQWLHSVDSWQLLSDIDRAAVEWQVAPRVLLEVNISGDATKHGWTPQELRDAPLPLSQLQAVRVSGLMGMSGLHANPLAARRQFAELRELFDRLQARGDAGPHWSTLSMGMSGDYELAIEEGSTMVRVGSALFEGLPGWE